MADQKKENHSHIITGSSNYHTGIQGYGSNLHGISAAYTYDGVSMRNLVDPWDSSEPKNVLSSSQIEKLVNRAVIKAKDEINLKINNEVKLAAKNYLEKESKDENGQIKKIIDATIKDDVQKKVEYAIENDVEKPESDSFMKKILKRVMGEKISEELTKIREENTTKIFTILGAVIGILSFIFISVNVVTQVDTLKSALILILAMAFLLMSFIFAMNLILVDKEYKGIQWWFKFSFMIILLGIILFGAIHIEGGLNEKSQKNQLDSMRKELAGYDEKLKISNAEIKTLNEKNELQAKILDCIKSKGYFSIQCY